MDFNVSIKSNVLVIKVSGELDDHGAGMMREKLDFLLFRKEIKHIIFDFTELTLMDSAGVGLLIGRYKLISSRGGEAYIIVTDEHVRKILKMSGVLNIFHSCGSINTALAQIND